MILDILKEYCPDWLCFRECCSQCASIAIHVAILGVHTHCGSSPWKKPRRLNARQRLDRILAWPRCSHCKQITQISSPSFTNLPGVWSMPITQIPGAAKKPNKIFPLKHWCRSFSKFSLQKLWSQQLFAGWVTEGRERKPHATGGGNKSPHLCPETPWRSWLSCSSHRGEKNPGAAHRETRGLGENI